VYVIHCIAPEASRRRAGTVTRRSDTSDREDRFVADGGFARSPRASAPVVTPATRPDNAVYVPKVCAYVTRGDDELLVFDGPGHDGVQVPKGTVEDGEPLDAALRREIREESGLVVTGAVTHLVTDVWTRRVHPPRRYVRHFYHVHVDEPRDAWTHVVTGDGSDAGERYAYRWTAVSADESFALSLDDYLPLLSGEGVTGAEHPFVDTAILADD
jgi:8-oxo-dGTP pyrophosphatase MutT (NUDIX family)